MGFGQCFNFTSARWREPDLGKQRAVFLLRGFKAHALRTRLVMRVAAHVLNRVGPAQLLDDGSLLLTLSLKDTG